MSRETGVATQMGNQGACSRGNPPGGGDLRLFPDRLASTYRTPAPTIKRSPGDHREWIDACKGGETAASKLDYGVRLDEIGLLEVLAIRAGRLIEWDASNMQVKGAPELNEIIRGTYRKAWEVGADQPLGAQLRLDRLAEAPDPKIATIAAELRETLVWPGKFGDGPLPLTETEQKLFDRGEKTYASLCSACHQADGRGLEGAGPSLAGSRWVLGSDEVLARIVLKGKRGPEGS